MNVLTQISWTLATACVLSSGTTTLRSHRKRPAPSWRYLHVFLSSALGLFVLAEAVWRESAWRHFFEFLAIVATFGGMALWIRANRVALAETDGCSCAEREIEIRMVDEPQRKGADYQVVLPADRDGTVGEGVLTGRGGRPQ